MGGVLGVYGTCRLVLLLSKATGRTQGRCPAGPKGPDFTVIQFATLLSNAIAPLNVVLGSA